MSRRTKFRDGWRRAAGSNGESAFQQQMEMTCKKPESSHGAIQNQPRTSGEHSKIYHARAKLATFTHDGGSSVLWIEPSANSIRIRPNQVDTNRTQCCDLSSGDEILAYKLPGLFVACFDQKSLNLPPMRFPPPGVYDGFFSQNQRADFYYPYRHPG